MMEMSWKDRCDSLGLSWLGIGLAKYHTLKWRKISLEEEWKATAFSITTEDDLLRLGKWC